MWDAFVDAWAIAAGAVPAPPHASGELQQAASILLGLAETGAMERLDGAQTTRLTAIGGDRWAGLRALPAGREARDAVFRLIFGARKRVEGELGLPAGSLPRSRTTPPDAPASGPAATARQLIAWARHRDLETEVVGGGLFAGEDLATWDPIALAGLDAELATTAARLAARVPGPLAGAARAGGPRHAVGGGIVPDAAQPVRDRVSAVRASGLRQVPGRDRLDPVGSSRPRPRFAPATVWTREPLHKPVGRTRPSPPHPPDESRRTVARKWDTSGTRSVS